MQYIYNGIVEGREKLYIKRKLLAIIILALFVLSAISCAPTSEVGFLRVLDLPARAEIEGERYGVEFKAKLIQSERDAEGMRKARLEFTAPDAFAGICVEYSCGVWGASLGEISFSGLAAEKLGAPISAFFSDGEVITVEKTTGDRGEAQTRICLQRGALVYEYLIDSKSGMPLSVKETTAAGEIIMKIKILEYKTD